MLAWGETPWITQNEVSFALSFSVGSKLCRVNMKITKGSIVPEVVQRLLNEESIPVYLHATLQDIVLRMVYETQLSPIAHSEDILDVGLMIEQARILSRQFDVTTTVSQHLAKSFATTFGFVDITWSLKPNPNFQAEMGRPGTPPRRPSSPSLPSSSLRSNGRPSSPPLDNLDAQKIISSSFARGSRTAQQSLQLAKMYHFLVAGDHSVTSKALESDAKSTEATSSSLIDGSFLDPRDASSSKMPVAIEPTIVKLDGSPEVSTLRKARVERHYFRKKKQTAGSELLLLQDTTNEFRDMISALERSLQTSMAQLTQGKETAIQTLSERQSREMDRASQGGRVELIPQLVEKHMEEMEGLEAKWQVELAEARKRQRHEYLAFCSDLYKNRDRYMEDKRAMGPQQVAALRQKHAASTMGHDTHSFGGKQGAKATAASSWTGSTWTSLIFGRSVYGTSASATSGNQPHADKVIRVAAANSSLLMARETTSTSGESGMYSIVVMLGSQLKVPFEVQLFGGGMLSAGNLGIVDSVTPTTPSSPHLLQQHLQALNNHQGSNPYDASSSSSSTSDSIYSSALSAIVLLTDPQLQCNSPTYNHFFSLAAHSTELHFESAPDQLENVRSQVLPPPTDSRPGPAKLEPGDFFVTTHSNLGRAQVVFHMVGERQNVASSWTQLLAGLRNILTVASHYDIATLSLPILLVEPEFRHLYSDGQGIKRAEEVIRTIRGFLVLNAASGISLKTVRLVFPPQQNSNSSLGIDIDGKMTDTQSFDKIKSIVSILFNQPLH